MSDELVVKKPGFKFTPKLTGLAAIKAAEAEKAAQALSTNSQTVVQPKLKDPLDMAHRIGILFDDSGSMSGPPLTDAKAGTEEFLRSCEKDNTAVAIYCMSDKQYKLNSNLPALAILLQDIQAIASTPLVTKLKKMLTYEKLTRAIVFSDGSPTDYNAQYAQGTEAYAAIIETKIPVDTVYIPDSFVDARAEAFMKKLAEDTGGIYLKLERGKSNFRTAFKYLSPGLRYMLADKSFADKLQGK